MSVEQQAETVFPVSPLMEVTSYDNQIKTVTIRKVTLRTMKPAIEYLNKIMNLLEVNEKTKTKGGGLNLRDPKIILKLISEMQEDTVKVLAAHCDLAYEEFLDLDIDQSVALAIRIFEVNRDFFTARVLPLIAPMLPGDLVVGLEDGKSKNPATHS
jgi:hypothetical protein